MKLKMKSKTSAMMVVALAMAMAACPVATAMGSKTVQVKMPAATVGGSVGLLGLGGPTLTATTTKATWQPSYGTSMFYYKNEKVAVNGAKAAVIDVSEWDGKIDWAKVKKASVKYAVIRCGYGNNKAAKDDKQWIRNAKQAKKNGIKFGVYLYSHAYNAKTAVGEAKHVLRCMKEAGLKPNDLALPVYYDLEQGGGSPKEGTHEISNLMLARIATTWCNAVAAEGFNVGIYSSTSWWSNYLTNDVFKSSKWSKWVAQYNSACTLAKTASGKQAAIADYGEKMDMWQFTCTGKCDGVNSGRRSIDVNWLFNTKFDSANTKVYMPGTITINYELNGGTNDAGNIAKVTNKSSLTVKLKNPTRTGYKFEGWYTTKNFKEGTEVAKLALKGGQKATVYAKWSKVKYTISYCIDGETASEDGWKTSYTVKTETWALPMPEKEGYGFAGWYTKKSCTGKIIWKVAKGNTGNLKLYGKWIKDAANYKVTAKGGLAVRTKAKAASKVTGTVSKGDVLCITKIKTVAKTKWGYAYSLGWITMASAKAL